MAFKRLSSLVEKAEEELPKLRDGVAPYDDALAANRELTSLSSSIMDDGASSMARFLDRANETDPDRQIYGQKMIDKIRALAPRFEHVRELLSEAETAVSGRVAEAQARSLAEEEERQARLEAERLEAERLERERLEAERKKEEEAAEAARKAEAEKRALAERLRQEEAERARRLAEEKVAAKEREVRERRELETKRAAEVARQAEEDRKARKALLEERMARKGRGGKVDAAGGSGGGVGGAEGGWVWRRGEVCDLRQPKEFMQAIETGKQEGCVTVIKFTAAWCGPCRAIAPAVHRMAQEMRNVQFVSIDGDVPAMRQTLSALGVRAFPTFLLYVDGRQIGQVRGADEKKLRAAIGVAQEDADEAKQLQEAIAMSKGEEEEGGEGEVVEEAGGGSGGGGSGGGGDGEDGSGEEESEEALLAAALAASLEEGGGEDGESGSGGGREGSGGVEVAEALSESVPITKEGAPEIAWTPPSGHPAGEAVRQVVVALGELHSSVTRPEWSLAVRQLLSSFSNPPFTPDMLFRSRVGRLRKGESTVLACGFEKAEGDTGPQFESTDPIRLAVARSLLSRIQSFLRATSTKSTTKSTTTTTPPPSTSPHSSTSPPRSAPLPAFAAGMSEQFASMDPEVMRQAAAQVGVRDPASLSEMQRILQDPTQRAQFDAFYRSMRAGGGSGMEGLMRAMQTGGGGGGGGGFPFPFPPTTAATTPPAATPPSTGSSEGAAEGGEEEEEGDVDDKDLQDAIRKSLQDE